MNMQRIYKKITMLFRPGLSREQLVAYFNGLPDQIGVEWFKEGKYIVGRIEADGKEYMTQGKNAEEFIAMVNDVILAVNEIPSEYLDAMSVKAYRPTEEQFALLSDRNVTKSGFKTRRQLQTA